MNLRSLGLKLSFLVLTLFTFSSLSYASNTIGKDSEVSVVSVHLNDKVLGLSIVGEDAVGPNYTLTKNFLAASGFSGDVTALKKAVKDDKDLKFVLKKDLQLLTDEEAAKAKLP